MRMPIVWWLLFICECKSLLSWSKAQTWWADFLLTYKYRYFNHLFFWSNLNSHTFQLFLENRATSNHLENKMSLNCIYRISSNKSPHSNKHPPSDKRPLPWPTYQKTTPLPTSNKRLPLASLPSLDNRDTRKTCCYWHLFVSF